MSVGSDAFALGAGVGAGMNTVLSPPTASAPDRRSLEPTPGETGAPAKRAWRPIAPFSEIGPSRMSTVLKEVAEKALPHCHSANEAGLLLDGSCRHRDDKLPGSRDALAQYRKSSRV